MNSTDHYEILYFYAKMLYIFKAAYSRYVIAQHNRIETLAFEPKRTDQNTSRTWPRFRLLTKSYLFAILAIYEVVCS